jgi:hypothetical protein
MLLTGQLGERVKTEGIIMLRPCVDNTSVVLVTNAFVAASRPMIRELRGLQKVVLDDLCLQRSSDWVLSVVNKFADGLSRRFFPGDLAVRETPRQSVADGMMAPHDASPLRPLGEHPVFLRRHCHTELASRWLATEETRLLCPPTDLLVAVVRKLRFTRAPALFLMPEWPRQSWYQAALDLSIKTHRFPLVPVDVWSGTHRLNPSWRLLMLEINLSPDASLQ